MSEIRDSKTRSGRMTFTPEAKQRLAATAMSPGYQELLDLMEQECIKLETECFNQHPADRDGINATWHFAAAAWRFFVCLQKRVQSEVDEFMLEQAPKKPRNEEEEILDPTRIPLTPFDPNQQ
jgi:hypothetical protein